MYKVLIVDDELLIIKSLKNRIKWKDFGFRVIGEAGNGIEAFEKIKQLNPDIVFTDIRMPGMSGLELVENVRKLDMNINFIIISGYAEFEYAQKALNFGAMGFCLKPFNVAEIGELLKNVKLKLDKSRLTYENEFITMLDGACSNNGEACRDILLKLGFDIDVRNGFRAAVSIGEEEICFSEEVDYLRFKIGREKYVYLFNNIITFQNAGQYLVNMPRNIKGAGISRVYYNIDFIDTAIDEAGISAAQYFITGRKDIYEYTDFNPKHFEKVVKDLKSVLLSKNIDGIAQMLDYMENVLKEESCSVRQAFKVYNLFFYMYGQNTGDDNDNSLESYQQLTGMYPDVTAMLASLKSLLYKNEEDSAGISDETGNETYKKVLNYINLNYYKDISVQSAAENFSANPNYISQLFKRLKGETFTEYLTNMRIKQARSMLKTTESAIYEVADFVGYNDYFYFAKVFKRITGMTPKAYRDCSEKSV